MTEGSLKLNETDRTSRSYTEITSTFPWHSSVIAFCQWTILSGSYVALRRSVCSIPVTNFARPLPRCQDAETVNASKHGRLAALHTLRGRADRCGMQGRRHISRVM